MTVTCPSSSGCIREQLAQAGSTETKPGPLCAQFVQLSAQDGTGPEKGASVLEALALVDAPAVALVASTAAARGVNMRAVCGVCCVCVRACVRACV